MTYAVPDFMANNTNYKVSTVGSGSGAGLVAIEANTCDIGMISDPANSVTSGTTTAYPNLEYTTIAYDGVALFMSQATMTAHGLTAAELKFTNAVADAMYQVAPAKAGFSAQSGGWTETQLGIVTPLPSWPALATSGYINTWADLETVLGLNSGMTQVAITAADTADTQSVQPCT